MRFDTASPAAVVALNNLLDKQSDLGRWLEQAGFKPDSRVCVHVEEGRLIITPA